MHHGVMYSWRGIRGSLGGIHGGSGRSERGSDEAPSALLVVAEPISGFCGAGSSDLELGGTVVKTPMSENVETPFSSVLEPPCNKVPTSISSAKLLPLARAFASCSRLAFLSTLDDNCLQAQPQRVPQRRPHDRRASHYRTHSPRWPGFDPHFTERCNAIIHTATTWDIAGTLDPPESAVFTSLAGSLSRGSR
jgi:hypothetical protein